MDYGERFSLICDAIEEELLSNKRKFIIYPFGANGLMTKDILNKRYGIQESMLVDNKLCHFRSDVRSVSQLVVLASGENRHYGSGDFRQSQSKQNSQSILRLRYTWTVNGSGKGAK